MEMYKEILQSTTSISNDAVKYLMDKTEVVNLQKGEIFLQEHAICNHFGYTHSGLLRFYYDKEGHEITEWFAPENTFWVSWKSFIKREPSNLIIEAFVESVVYIINYDDLMYLVQKHQEVSNFYNVMKEIALVGSLSRIDTFHFETAEQRYEKFVKDYPTVLQRAALIDIASYLGITPETLSRIRNKIGKKKDRRPKK